MTIAAQTATPSTLDAPTIQKLHGVSLLSSLSEDRLHCLDGATSRHAETDEAVVKAGDQSRIFMILLEGQLRVSIPTPAGYEQTVHVLERGETFGEVQLMASMPWTMTLRANEPSDLLVLEEDQFWRLMTECSEVRKVILGNMAQRLAKMQSNTFQQEKMAALGTLAAGLMHELNNPGAAARRASSQLRENLVRLQELAGRFTERDLTREQKECVLELQHHALSNKPAAPLSSLEQTDAEEALSDWMESAHVPDPWKLAPTLVSIGIDAATLECARSSFPDDVFSDAINWLEALASSMQLVGTIEESISRVTDLVAAVKTYAYEGKGQRQSTDVNQSMHATLVILAHKMREKRITMSKSFTPNLPAVGGECHGLNQVWTNLLDNAIDAVSDSGHIKVKTWAEQPDEQTGGKAQVCVSVEDDGPGIPLECQPRIFDPFFTTKPVGVGTGLGLGIVYRIVEQCGGSIHFSSVPGCTEFVVRLPAA
jgi:signal transduction histidine kinase